MARLVWVKERWSDTVQSRGVCAGAFGARVGEERASQARWAGALLGVVVVDWQRRRVRLLAIASMGRLEMAGTQVNGGRAEGKVRCRCCGDRNAAWMLECCRRRVAGATTATNSLVSNASGHGVGEQDKRGGRQADAMRCDAWPPRTQTAALDRSAA
jgi:hypothetical protein